MSDILDETLDKKISEICSRLHREDMEDEIRKIISLKIENASAHEINQYLKEFLKLNS